LKVFNLISDDQSKKSKRLTKIKVTELYNELEIKIKINNIEEEN